MNGLQSACVWEHNKWHSGLRSLDFQLNNAPLLAVYHHQTLAAIAVNQQLIGHCATLHVK